VKKLWFITIYDGEGEIDHFFIDGKIRINKIINYFIWLVYINDKYDLNCDDIISRNGDNLAMMEEDGGISIYGTNFLPDISIVKINCKDSIPDKKHNMKLNNKENWATKLMKIFEK
jgi:hypothetical protein